MTLWLCITLDQYELPTAVADTSYELARLCGVSKNTIISSVSHSKKYGYRSRYIKVEVEDIDEQQK